MAQLSWGKPKIEFGKLGADGAAPTKWDKLEYDPVENSTKLTTSKGEKKEAKVEGGENEAVKYSRNTSTASPTPARRNCSSPALSAVALSWPPPCATK